MSVIFLDEPPAAAYEYRIDWLDHPSGRLALGEVLGMDTSVYQFDDPLTVRLLAPTPTSVSCCRQGFVSVDLDEGETLLLADNRDSMFPVHVAFDTPVSKVGAFVSADAATGRNYKREMAVLLEGQTQWQTFTMVAPLTKNRGTAAFLAVSATNGSRIAEIGFDVMNVPGVVAKVRRVAIGSLYVTP